MTITRKSLKHTANTNNY